MLAQECLCWLMGPSETFIHPFLYLLPPALMSDKYKRTLLASLTTVLASHQKLLWDLCSEWLFLS